MMKHVLRILILQALLLGGFFAAKAQTTIHGTYKAVTISFDQNVPYSKTLILLHEIYNGSTTLSNNFVVGTITALRGGTGATHRLNVVDIRSGSAYNSYRASITGQNSTATGWKLKTCIYNSKKYMALEVPYLAQQHSQGFHFVGWILSSGESLKTVTYDVNGVPQNQSILSDVQDYTSSVVAHYDVGRFVVNGNVGIGTTNPQAKLAVNGDILAKEVKVKSDISVPDYVFEPDYDLPPLDEIEAYVNQHKHLPEIPSAADIKRDGLDLAEMNLLLLKKVEELTLHLIAQRKDKESLRNQVNDLQHRITQLELSTKTETK